ncbi:MAG TPA: hypothetical protein VH251_03995, partial [Verrucomicrobiae bacterium]|nr:hypothetical protein [Verrucomicrobiae bacterium]
MSRVTQASMDNPGDIARSIEQRPASGGRLRKEEKGFIARVILKNVTEPGKKFTRKLCDKKAMNSMKITKPDLPEGG